MNTVNTDRHSKHR